jgi:hypothetical protein
MIHPPVITVLSHARNHDLVDLATVKEELEISDNSMDSRLSRWIKVASRQIVGHCNRYFWQETLQESFRLGSNWEVSGDAQPIMLSRPPIVSITSILEDTFSPDTLDPTDYEVDKFDGFLWRTTGVGPNFRIGWMGESVVVTYVGGYKTIPDDITEACISLVRLRQASRTRDPSLRSITFEGVGSETYATSPGELVNGLPAEVANMLLDYRVEVV